MSRGAHVIDVARELAKHFDGAALGRERVRFDGAELPLVAPDSIDGFVEAVRFAAREKLAIVPTGLGSKLGWRRPAERADFLLSTRRFAGVVSHVPDDGTIAVRAGTRMSELREIARRGGHFLTPDVPHPARKTIGGVIAAGESGADRLRFGPVRHHVLGLKVVLADGTVTKCGGQLVKNVTGFDLMRLYTGSHGTLCVIVEAALRLFPEPEHELWLDMRCDTAVEASAITREIAGRAARPVAISHDCLPDRGGRLTARLFGRAELVDSEREFLAERWPKASLFAGRDARAAAELRRDSRISGVPSLHLAFLPTRLDEAMRGFEKMSDVAPSSHELGIATLDLDLPDGPALQGDWWIARAKQLVASGVAVSVRDAPGAWLPAAPSALSPAALDLMRALKRGLDPAGVFARAEPD